MDINNGFSRAISTSQELVFIYKSKISNIEID